MVTLGSVAVIPARGGSKRIPRKNVREFAGRPLIAWTIEAARDAGVFDRIVVSTDDPEIAEVGRQYGAAVPFLRDAAHDDVAPVSAATLRTLAQLESQCGERFERTVQLMPNCPLRHSGHLRAAWQRFLETDADFMLSHFEAPLVIPWWAVRLDAEGRPAPLFPEALKRRSQDLEHLYFPTGAIWLARSAALREAGTFYGPGYRACIVPWEAAVDIDTEEDWRLAEAVRAAGTGQPHAK